MKGECMISKILVPTDGSEAAHKAALFAIDLAKQLKASIAVLSVVEHHSLLGKIAPASKEAKHIIQPMGFYLKEAAEQFAAEIKKLCDKNKIAADVSIRTGHPVTEIVGEAERVKADIVVMGSHGRGALSSAFLGSISRGVIHSDKNIRVLIVRG